MRPLAATGCGLTAAERYAAADQATGWRAWASQPLLISPSATITAGPVRRLARASGMTVSVPPGTRTVHAPGPSLCPATRSGHSPAAAAAATAAATAPVPQD